MNGSIVCLMCFEENERIDNETIKRIKRKKNKCPFNNKGEKESTEVSHKDLSSFCSPKERKEGFAAVRVRSAFPCAHGVCVLSVSLSGVSHRPCVRRSMGSVRPRAPLTPLGG